MIDDLEQLPTKCTFTGPFLQFVTRVPMLSSETLHPMFIDALIGSQKDFGRIGFSQRDKPFTLSVYGLGKRLAPSYTPEFGLEHVAPEDNAPVDDFVVVEFKGYVFPTKIGVYQRGYPGAVARIWARRGAQGTWSLLWDRRYDELLDNSSAQLFLPKIRTIEHRTNKLRFEFHISEPYNICCIEGIALVGVIEKPEQSLQESWLPTTLDELYGEGTSGSVSPVANGINITALPYELLLKIISYVDLKSLLVVAQVCKTLAAVVQDRHLYREVNMRPYWYKIDTTCLKWLGKRCSGIEKLDLSWCGLSNESSLVDLYNFLRQHGATLTHLRLNSIRIMHGLAMVLIYCSNLTELCLKNAHIDPTNLFRSISLQHLTKLDLAGTTIAARTLVSILQQNPGLKHLNLMYYIYSVETSVIETIGQYNRELVSLNLSRTRCFEKGNRNNDKLKALKNCSKLQELNLDLSHHCESEQNLGELMECFHGMRWLGLACTTNVGHHVLTKIAIHCPELQFLDLDECRNVLAESVSVVLAGCPKLRLLKLAYCNQIESRWFSEWERLYPLVKIENIC